MKNRRSIRLKEYDYSQSGAYFVTVCTYNRECLFGEIVGGAMVLNDAGRIVQAVWNSLPSRFPELESDVFVVMPNHIHGIIVIHGRGESCIRPDVCREPNLGDHKDRPYGTTTGSLGRIIQAFKSMVTHEYVMSVRQQRWQPFNGKLWQRNYYERVIRNENELNDVRQYIVDNPAKWDTDEENPNAKPPKL